MQLAWFRWLYDRVVAGLAWAQPVSIDPIKRRLATSFGVWSPAEADISLSRIRFTGSSDLTRRIALEASPVFRDGKTPNAVRIGQPDDADAPGNPLSAIMP